MLLATCARPELGTPTPDVSRPDIRIGLALGSSSVTIGGGEAQALSAPDESEQLILPPGATAVVSSEPGGLRVVAGSETLRPGPALVVVAQDSGRPVRWSGRDYRGSLLVSAGPGGLMTVNTLPMEEYIRGVVGAEMGKRGEPELAALRAQAVISRTLAYRNLGRWRVRGYDLMGTVADQAYAGIGFESPASDQAALETAGEVLTYAGGMIDVFFHSTCAGRTARGSEVFSYAERPYLQSVPDLDLGGRPWCAISPRYRWREQWSGEALARALRATLPAAGGSPGMADDLADFRILERTPTGRVARLQVVTRGGESLTLSGPAARLLLRTPDGSNLRSADFTLQVTREGPRIVQLVAEGAGAGHGVGMCQWGALGRSRAGFSYQEILSAYFPGTEVVRTY